MRHWIFVSMLAALAIAILAIRPGYSDDAKRGVQKSKAQKPAVAKDAAEKPQSTKRKPARGRLPNYYGKVGISKEQRSEIYSIQDQYAPQLAELRKQMATLVTKRNDEIEAVLTESQRKDLVKAREEAKRQALERAKKAAEKRAAVATKKRTAAEK